MTHPKEGRQDDAPWGDPLWNLAHQRAVATAGGLYPEHMQQGRREAYWRALQREFNSLAGIDPPKATKTYADGLRKAAEIARTEALRQISIGAELVFDEGRLTRAHTSGVLEAVANTIESNLEGKR